jgi:hypothetical protein
LKQKCDENVSGPNALKYMKTAQHIFEKELPQVKL